MQKLKSFLILLCLIKIQKIIFFIIKFYFKFSENTDWFFMNKKKINYIMFYLKNNAAHIMNLFFWNNMFCIFDLFISLLKQTYDNTSHKHSAATKLEKLQQQNHKFTSFFSKFLNLVEEFKWNKTAKIDAFRQKISDEVQIQLIDHDFLNTLLEFITLCQQIDEDICFVNTAQFWKNSISQFMNFIIQTTCLSKNSVFTKKLINIDNKNI